MIKLIKSDNQLNISNCIEIIRNLILNYEWFVIIKNTCPYSIKFKEICISKNYNTCILEINSTNDNYLKAFNQIFYSSIYTVPRIVYKQNLIGGLNEYKMNSNLGKF